MWQEGNYCTIKGFASTYCTGVLSNNSSPKRTNHNLTDPTPQSSCLSLTGTKTLINYTNTGISVQSCSTATAIEIIQLNLVLWALLTWLTERYKYQTLTVWCLVETQLRSSSKTSKWDNDQCTSWFLEYHLVGCCLGLIFIFYIIVLIYTPRHHFPQEITCRQAGPNSGN